MTVDILVVLIYTKDVISHLFFSFILSIFILLIYAGQVAGHETERDAKHTWTEHAFIFPYDNIRLLTISDSHLVHNECQHPLSKLCPVFMYTNCAVSVMHYWLTKSNLIPVQSFRPIKAQ